MYQAQISQNGQPVTNALLIHAVAMMLGCSPKREAVDTEQGIWLLDIREEAAEMIERDGGMDATIATCRVVIDLP